MGLWAVGAAVSMLAGACTQSFRRSEVDPGQSFRDDWLKAGHRTLAQLAATARGDDATRQRYFYYDAIVVPGSPATPAGGISWLNAQRIGMAVQLYNAGLAPFLIFSGGAVHNRYVEAEIMAAEARRRGVPADAIIEEPWAQHTTENVRYSVIEGLNRAWRRLVFVSDPGQAFYIARFTRDSAAYGGVTSTRYYHGRRTVHMALRHCPQKGIGTLGNGSHAPAGSPRCRPQGAGSH